LGIGKDPKGLSIAVVNYEFLSLNESCETRLEVGCPFHTNYSGLLSCYFLELVDKDDIKMKVYENEEDALNDVKDSRYVNNLSSRIL
jgi:hypothetical protein